MYTLVGYIVLAPILGFLINGFLGKKFNSEKLSGLIGSGAIGISFVIACLIFNEMLNAPVEGRSHVVTVFHWLTAGSFSVDVAYQVDQLSILMTLVVTGV